MKKLSRRQFIETSAWVGMSAAVPFTAAAAGRRAGPNETLRIATVGVKGRGGSHVSSFSEMKDVQVAAICDIDPGVIKGAMKKAEEEGNKPTYYQDIRKLLEDKTIDAISVATCNHWHTLASIWAIQAGKHVYVEKPLSHNVWEGRKLLEAARKYKKMVQQGSQSRSNGGWRKAVAALRAGKLGKVKVARGLCYKPRGSIGKFPDEPVPPGVDYDIWLGPAPVRPFNKNRFHYNWHWHWDYGNGDIGNQGIHEMDKARWALGQELPVRVASLGGRFGYEDAGETPNTQISVLDYADGSQVVFEVRGLRTDQYLKQGIGNLTHCEGGLVVGSDVQDLEGKKVDLKDVESRPLPGGGDHFRNFVECCFTGKHEDLAADVLQGHLSCVLVHLSNISYQLGEQKLWDGKTEPFDNEAGNETFRRMVKHLQDHKVDLTKTPMQVGRVLKFDPKTERFVDAPDADKLLTRDYRKPFVVPENP